MYQFTTPRVVVKMPDSIRVANITNGVFTFSQKNRNVLSKEDELWSLDTAENKIIVQLSQEETGSFAIGNLVMQIHFRIGADVYATKEMETKVYKNLHQEVLD